MSQGYRAILSATLNRRSTFLGYAAVAALAIVLRYIFSKNSRLMLGLANTSRHQDKRKIKGPVEGDFDVIIVGGGKFTPAELHRLLPLLGRHCWLCTRGTA